MRKYGLALNITCVNLLRRNGLFFGSRLKARLCASTKASATSSSGVVATASWKVAAAARGPPAVCQKAAKLRLFSHTKSRASRQRSFSVAASQWVEGGQAEAETSSILWRLETGALSLLLPLSSSSDLGCCRSGA